MRSADANERPAEGGKQLKITFRHQISVELIRAFRSASTHPLAQVIESDPRSVSRFCPFLSRFVGQLSRIVCLGHSSEVNYRIPVDSAICRLERRAASAKISCRSQFVVSAECNHIHTNCSNSAPCRPRRPLDAECGAIQLSPKTSRTLFIPPSVDELLVYRRNVLQSIPISGGIRRA